MKKNFTFHLKDKTDSVIIASNSKSKKPKEKLYSAMHVISSFLCFEVILIEFIQLIIALKIPIEITAI